jgi:hypothetical protein
VLHGWSIGKFRKPIAEIPFRFVSSRPAFVVTIALSLIIVMAVVGTVQNQKAIAQGRIIDKIKNESIIQKLDASVEVPL